MPNVRRGDHRRLGRGLTKEAHRKSRDPAVSARMGWRPEHTGTEDAEAKAHGRVSHHPDAMESRCADNEAVPGATGAYGPEDARTFFYVIQWRIPVHLRRAKRQFAQTTFHTRGSLRGGGRKPYRSAACGGSPASSNTLSTASRMMSFTVVRRFTQRICNCSYTGSGT